VSLQVVDGIIELPDGLVVAVDDGVQQPISQAADLVGGVHQVGVEVR
jgi:hypothetical protein